MQDTTRQQDNTTQYITRQDTDRRQATDGKKQNGVKVSVQWMAIRLRLVKVGKEGNATQHKGSASNTTSTREGR
jgi:hypothetical protein